ncbi:hypothetical protein LTR36_008625 [Oleoguttula mirabilis]|uniref:Uncharacterized protein n=1 Tax=Oleoguttula mirabilis TaxID=1507867 RepID=A0AAV9JUV0_9PEZI|nr:hypothetical protein LTR36_008625 [Oleoguttula mirabilis]
MSCSDASSSTASSPTLNGQSFPPISPPTSALPKPAMRKASSRSPSMSPIPEDASTASPIGFPESADEMKLHEINADIKSTLTDLLNCEAVRKDSKMRLWVATRLMNAELELKRQRKRRRSTATIVLGPSDGVEMEV